MKSSKKLLIFIYLFLLINLSRTLVSESRYETETFSIEKEFNVQLPCYKESFIMGESECFEISETSSFKIEKLEDEIYVGVQYLNENCSYIENKFQFKCTNNYLDIISCEFFKIACTNEIVIPPEEEKKIETIKMEQYGYKGNFDNSVELLQALNDLPKPPRTFASPHKVAYADDDDDDDDNDSNLLQAVEVNQTPIGDEIIPIEEKDKEDFKIKNSEKNNKFDQKLYENLVLKFKQFKFGSVDSIFLIKDFITKEEEETILSNVYSKENEDKWTQLKRRRLQNWGGNPISSGMIEEEIPQWLNIICEKIHNTSIFPTTFGKPNHVLLNEYNVNEGIMPHKDGPLFFPMVCILSLNSTCIMDFYKNLKEEPFEKIFLRPRSLLIFTEDAYKNYFHGIKESYSDIITKEVMNKNVDENDLNKEFDRGVRVSLTIRIVPNTIKKEKLNVN